MAQTPEVGSEPQTEPPSRTVALAPDVWLVQSDIRAGRQPDGNSVVFRTEHGMAVFDTGRHEWHRRAIFDLLAAENRTLTAIFNSHWHLDHVTGNLALKARWPLATVYATGAIDRAIEVFLIPSLETNQPYLTDESLPQTLREDVAGDMETVRNRAGLMPDVRVAVDGPLLIDGLSLNLRLAPLAATDADLWVMHPASGTVAVGDLVTLPAPFLDTACPDGWLAAFDAISSTSFERLIPGHGAVMDRAGFETYRTAFRALIDCVGSDSEPQVCADAWAEGVAPLLGPDAREPRIARGMTAAYVETLRANGGRSPTCVEPV